MHYIAWNQMKQIHTECMYSIHQHIYEIAMIITIIYAYASHYKWVSYSIKHRNKNRVGKHHDMDYGPPGGYQHLPQTLTLTSPGTTFLSFLVWQTTLAMDKLNHHPHINPSEIGGLLITMNQRVIHRYQLLWKRIKQYWLPKLTIIKVPKQFPSSQPINPSSFPSSTSFLTSI